MEGLPQSPLEEDDELVEAALEEVLARLAAGESLELEAYRERLPARHWARFAGTARAEEYRWRVQKGEGLAVEPLLECLDADAREHFFGTLAAARLARSVLPHKIEPGMEIRGRWVVLRTLGSGGQAKVYAAWDREFELEVALKVFDEPALGKQDTWALAALSESRVLAHLRSRNIVRIFDVVREEGLIIVVMDLVRGLRLRDALDRLRVEEAAGARQSERTARLRLAIGCEREGEHADLLVERDWYRTAARLALVMARTLEQAHERGIVHRDLTPKNAMLVGGGEPVLLDFGLATRRGAEGPLGWTVPYVAPERITAEGSGTEAQADVYQLGLVMYELLTLERAFAQREGESGTAVLLRIARGDCRRPREFCPGVSEALEAIALHALATRPEERYATAGELARDLERWLRGLPPLTAPLRRAARLRMRARHTLTSPAVLAIAALATVFQVSSVLAGSDWTAPRVSPLVTRIDEGGPLFAPITGTSIQRANSLLGADVDCAAGTYLYAFALSGDSATDAGLTIRPTPCFSPERSGHVESGALRLEPGRHRLSCTQLASAEEREGLLLLFSQHESAVLARLQQTLGERSERFEWASFGELPSILAELAGPTKGDSVATLDADTLRRLNERAQQEQPVEETLADLWRSLGVHVYLDVFEVGVEEGAKR